MIECIRVDGASDEGPSHLEVQYWWTERHLLQASAVTLITTRSSGSSYLNRVELQNGCLTRAHSNLFIPSTLHGSHVTGTIDKEIVCKNLSTAIDTYIERCDGAPCGWINIYLYKRATCEMTKREKLLVFQKSSKKDQKKLKETDPDIYKEFERVWAVRNRHMVMGLPSQYVFFLCCCYKSECCHPLCRKGKPEELRWFPGGPTIDFSPFSTRYLSTVDCSDCKSDCYGHFLKPDKYLKNISEASAVMSIPIKEFLQPLGRPPLKSEVETLSRSVLLSEQDVNYWIEQFHKIGNEVQSKLLQSAEKSKTANLLWSM